MIGKTDIYHSPKEIELDSQYPVVWLASWYPSRTSPFNGDFIQRHAQAVAAFMPVLVIHTIHDEGLQHPVQYELRRNGSLAELLIYFRHAEPRGFTSALSYNFHYYRYTRAFIRHMVRLNGKPAAFHVHVPMKMGRVAEWARHLFGIPYIVSEQSGKYVGNASDAFANRSFIHRHGVRNVFRGAEAVTNVSQTVGELIRNMFGLREVQVIHNVVDTSVFRYEGRKRSSTFRFLHASTLSEQKNFDGILRVFDKLYEERKDFELVVIGGDTPSSPERPWLHGKGILPYVEVAKHMRQADAFVLFSRYENFPCVNVEALCSGLPVITSDAGGSGEAVNMENGLVVPSENEKALHGALIKMMDDADQYNRAAISGQAADLYSYQQIGSRFVGLYRSLGHIS